MSKRPRSLPAVIIPTPPWETAPFTLMDAVSVRAVAEGKATEEQQRTAFRWIVERACRTNRMSFQPVDPHGSAFAEGRRFPGLQLMRLINAPMGTLKAEVETRDARVAGAARDAGTEQG